MKSLFLLSLLSLQTGQTGQTGVPRATDATPTADVGTLVVLNKSDHTASFIDPVGGETLFVVETGKGPHEVAVSPDGKTAVVADYGESTAGNTLTVIDVASREVHRRIDLGEYGRPHGLVFLEGGKRLLVTAETKRALIEVDLEQGSVLRAMPTEQDASHMVAVAPDGSCAYVANIGSGSLSAIDLTTGERLANVTTGAGCEGVDVTPDGAEVWTSDRGANTVSIVDAATLEVIDKIETPAFPIRVKITPDGQLALVSCAQAGVVAVYDAESRELVRKVAMEYDPAAGSEEHLFRNTFGESPVPIGIQVRPDGRFAYVANTNANKIAVLDLETLEVVGALTAGRQPDGLGWIPPRKR